MEYEPVSIVEDDIARKIVSAAYRVHSNLGPGLLESIYETCFCHELSKSHLTCERQVEIPIVYDGIELPGKMRLDVLVEDLVICELKAVETMNHVYLA